MATVVVSHFRNRTRDERRSGALREQPVVSKRRSGGQSGQQTNCDTAIDRVASVLRRGASCWFVLVISRLGALGACRSQDVRRTRGYRRNRDLAELTGHVVSPRLTDGSSPTLLCNPPGSGQHRWPASTLISMDLAKTRTRCHRASKVMLLAVVNSTTKPSILRNGLTPRTSSSTAQIIVATAPRTCSVVAGVPPFG